MSRIRPFRPEDTEAVADLYVDVRWGCKGGADAGLIRWLQDTLAHPWVDDEVPSLVATGSRGEVVGFLASHVRRFVADGRPIRVGCSGHLVVAEQARRLGTGAMLTATYLRGPQDLSITDGATTEMAGIWEGLGGDIAPLQQLTWVRPVAPWRHPLRLAGTLVDLVSHRPLGPVEAYGLPEVFGGRSPGVSVSPLTPAAMLAILPTVTARLRLHPAYDEPFATWLLTQVASSARGALRAGGVRDRHGRALGYYAYLARPGGPSPVVCLAAATAGSSTTVLEAMVSDARACGVAALFGRVEPRLVPSLRGHRTVMQLRDCKALVHSRDPELRYLATSRHALLTWLEGEWCLVPPSPVASGHRAPHRRQADRRAAAPRRVTVRPRKVHPQDIAATHASASLGIDPRRLPWKLARSSRT